MQTSGVIAAMMSQNMIMWSLLVGQGLKFSAVVVGERIFAFVVVFDLVQAREDVEQCGAIHVIGFEDDEEDVVAVAFEWVCSFCCEHFSVSVWCC